MRVAAAAAEMSAVGVPHGGAAAARGPAEDRAEDERVRHGARSQDPGGRRYADPRLQGNKPPLWSLVGFGNGLTILQIQ